MPNDAPGQAVTALEEYPCVCGASAVTGRQVEARDPFSRAIFSYTACAACGAERMLLRPTAERIGAYYPPSYGCFIPDPTRPPSLTDRIKDLVYRTYYKPDTAPNFRLRALLWPFRRRSVMAFRQPALRHVFEIGAGVGTDLMTFRAAGWQVGGCEPSAHACAAAADQGIILQHCIAEEAEIPGGVSCVFMNNVFEHFHDPLAILRRIHASLTDDGVVVAIVPNHASWTARVFGAAWPGYDAPRHIWGWTPKSIARALHQAGFVVDYINQQAPVSLWSNTLAGVNAPTPPHRFLQWMGRTRLASRSLVPLGWLAAAAGHGDYIRVVARKA